MAVDAGTVVLPVVPGTTAFPGLLRRQLIGGGGAGALRKIGLGVGGLVAAGIAGGVAAFNLGKTFDDAFDIIRIGTGATGKALEGLKGDFRAVFRTVPTDTKSAATAIADLNTRLGLTGRPLREVSRRVLELSRLTGEDLNQVIPATTRLFGDWSIRTQDMPGHLDKLFRASQATGIGVSDLSRLMVQFGSPLRQLGFSFDFTAAMFANFEKAGVATATLMPGLRFAIKNLSKPTDDLSQTMKRLGIDMSEGPEKALAAVMQAIKDAPNALAANAIAFDVFGVRAGPDMAAAIREGRFELEDLIKQVRGGSDTILQAARDTRDWRESWQIIVNNGMLLFEPVANRVFGMVSDWMGWLVDTGIPALRRWGRLWAGLGEEGGVRAFADAIDDLLGGRGRFTGFITAVVEGLADVWTGFGDLGRDIGNWARGIAGSIARNVRLGNWEGVGRTLSFAVTSALEGLGRASGKVFRAFVDLFDRVDWVALGRAVLPAILGLVLGIVDAFMDPFMWLRFIRENWPVVLGVVLGFMFAPARFLKPVVRLLRRIPLAGRFLAWIVEGLSRIGSRITRAAGQLWRSFTGGFTGAITRTGGGVFRRIGAWIDDIVTYARVLMSELWDRILRGAAGLGRQLARPLNLVSRLWARFWGGLGRLLAAVWRGYWRLVGRGLAVIGRGILRALTALGRVWTRFWDSALGRLLTRAWREYWRTITRGWQLIIRFLSRAFTALRTAWTRFWRALWEGLRDRWNAMRDLVRDRLVAIRSRFDTWRANLGRAWRSFWDGIRDRARTIWNNLRDLWRERTAAIRDRVAWLVERVRTIWGRIANVFRIPINWVINNVWNKGIVKAWNFLAKRVGFGTLRTVDPLPTFQRGGPIPGTGRGDRVPILAEAGEFVVNRRSTSKFRGLLELINNRRSPDAREVDVDALGFHRGGEVSRRERSQSIYARRLQRRLRRGYKVYEDLSFPGMGWHARRWNDVFAKGFFKAHPNINWGWRNQRRNRDLLHRWLQRFRAPGFQLGGIVDIGRAIQRMGYRVGEHPSFGGVAPVHSRGSLHYAGRAIDVNWGPPGTSTAERGALSRLASWILRNVARKNIQELFWPANDPVGGHHGHLHFGIGSGGGRFISGQGGLLMSLWEQVRDRVTGIFGRVRDRLGDFARNPFTRLLARTGRHLTGEALEWLRDKAQETLLGGGGGAAAGGGGPVRKVVQAVARTFGWGSGAQWNALTNIISRESSWVPTAQNQSSTAFGLFQFLNSTWAGTGIGKTSNPRLQTIAGLRYIRSRYGSPIRAWNFWRRNNWYDDGGWLPPGLSLAVNDTGEPERVLAPGQVDRLSARLGAMELASALQPYALKPGDRVQFVVEGTPLTATVRRVNAAAARSFKQVVRQGG